MCNCSCIKPVHTWLHKAWFLQGGGSKHSFLWCISYQIRQQQKWWMRNKWLVGHAAVKIITWNLLRGNNYKGNLLSDWKDHEFKSIADKRQYMPVITFWINSLASSKGMSSLPIAVRFRDRQRETCKPQERFWEWWLVSTIWEGRKSKFAHRATLFVSNNIFDGILKDRQLNWAALENYKPVVHFKTTSQ